MEFVERSQQRKVGVAGGLAIRSHQLVREPAGVQPVEIHREEPNVRSDVDVTQPLAELDAVDDRDRIAGERDMLAAQIAVAFAYAAAERATVEQAPAQLDCAMGETTWWLTFAPFARRNNPRRRRRGGPEDHSGTSSSGAPPAPRA